MGRNPSDDPDEDTLKHSTAKDHAALSLAQEAYRLKCQEDRARDRAFLRSKGYSRSEDYNAAKAEEFMQRGKPPAEFTAAAYRDAER